MSTNGAYPNEMNESTLFIDALRAAVPARPEPSLGTALVPRLAEVARAAGMEAETQPQAPAIATRPAPRRRTRRSLVARVAIAVCLIPLLFAGLAVAGVTVPEPARDAFDSVGISLPNQPAEKQSPEQPATKEGKPTSGEGSGGNDVSEAAQTKSKGKGGNSKAAHEHAREQREKAQGKAKGHDRGNAVGLNDATPPGQSGQTGPPPHSNAGGNARGSSGGGSSTKPPKPKNTPKGVAKGHAKTPPGQSK